MMKTSFNGTLSDDWAGWERRHFDKESKLRHTFVSRRNTVISDGGAGVRAVNSAHKTKNAKMLSSSRSVRH